MKRAGTILHNSIVRNRPYGESIFSLYLKDFREVLWEQYTIFKMDIQGVRSHRAAVLYNLYLIYILRVKRGDKMYKYLIFDFDGTIVDSDNTMNEIINSLAEKYNFNDYSRDFKNLSISQKLKTLFFVQKVKPEFRKIYGEKIDTIKAFDKMIALIESLYQSGYSLSILTSNTEDNVKRFFRLNDISFNIPIISSKGFFGKTKVIRKYIENNNCLLSDVLYIGDEIRDIKACNKAGIDIAFVKWGLDGKKDIAALATRYAVSTPIELENLLKAQ